MNKIFKTLVAAAAVAALAPAGAATFNSASTQGGTVVADYSLPGLVSFDIDFKSMAPATLNYTVNADDLTSPLQWSAILRNFASVGFEGYVVTLGQGSFATMGTVTRQFGGATSIAMAGGEAIFAFTPPEFLDVEVGNALGSTPGALNWTLGGLVAGDALSITVTPVPEPGTWGLMAAGLGLVGWLARRRRV
jgi:PEP-CTERM motif